MFSASGRHKRGGPDFGRGLSLFRQSLRLSVGLTPGVEQLLGSSSIQMTSGCLRLHARVSPLSAPNCECCIGRRASRD